MKCSIAREFLFNSKSKIHNSKSLRLLPMSRPVSILLAIALALGATEAMAWWWMHPAPAGLGQPVLCYRPGDRGQRSGVRGQEEANANVDHSPSTIHDLRSPSLPTVNRQPPTANSTPASDLGPPASDSSSSIQHSKSKIQNPAAVNDRRYTPLPELVTKSLPRLSATAGTAARIDRDDGSTIHLAFFEWDLADSKAITVFESFIHLPEECMGSIGMKLVSHQAPRSYQVGGEILSFDHTIFRDSGGIIVHTFKCTWVSGSSTLLGNGVRGGMEQWRQLHFKAAFKRFRPAYARVAQGAVRGIPSPDAAWHAFESAMLVDLTFEG
jgi:hypothetical protein